MSNIINSISLFFNNDIITYLISIIWFISITFIICFIFNKKFFDSLFLSFIFSALLLFIGGLINHISYLYYLGWIVIILFYAFLIHKKKIVVFIKQIDYISIVVYLVLSLIIFIVYQNAGLRFTDEFMHWAPMTKEMFRLDKFYCTSESLLLVHKDYPPFFSLIELLFCIFGARYCEKYLYVGLLSFVLSIIIRIIGNSKHKITSLIIIILSGFIFQYIPSVQDNTGLYNSIYIDYALSFVFAYSLYFIFSNKENDNYYFFTLFLLLSALLLSKQIGMYYFGICLITLLFYDRSLIKNKWFIITVLLSLVPLITWKICVNLNQIVGQFSISNFVIRPEWKEICKSYLDALISKSLFIKPFAINSILAVVLVLIGLYFSNKKNSKLSIVYFISFVLYLLVIGLLYMFVFSIEESIVLSSFERYIISYIYVGVLLMLFTICETNNYINYLIYLVFIVLLSDFNNSNINNILDKKNILVINQQGADIEFNFNQQNGSIYKFDIQDYLDEKNIDSFKEITDKYDYIYVYLYDDIFYKKWSSLTNTNTLENDSLHYIENHNTFNVVNSNFNRIYYVIKYYLINKEK